MKKVFKLVLVIIIMTLTACSNKVETKIENLSNKEGMAPYEFSENDKYLLQSLDLEKDVNIISFKAPKAAKNLKVKVYILGDNGKWNTIGAGGISSGQDESPHSRLEGTFAMLLKDDYSIDMHITTMGRASYQSQALEIDHDFVASSKKFLSDFQAIELNKEIPVAMMIYNSDTRINSYSMDSFYSPSEFEGVDLVQVVTLAFTDTND